MKSKSPYTSNRIHLFASIILFLSMTITVSALDKYRAQAAPTETFTVEYTFDVGDLNPGDTHCDASADPGDQCTLRAAIQETNALAGEQEIIVNPGNYILTGSPDENDGATGDLDIKGDLIITGVDADTTIIDGNGSDRIFHIFSNVSTNIQNLTLRNGNPGNSQGGGAILNEWGFLTLEDSKVLTSTATYGGGIYIYGASGTGLIKNSLISDNRSSYGGGILNSGVLTLMNSEVSENRIATNTLDGGGGINNTSDLTISESTITNNHNPYGNGGGIFSKQPGTVMLTDSTVSHNTSSGFGAGLFINGGGLSVTGSTINYNNSDSYGGGLFILDCASYLTNSTISGNRADGRGGGLYIDYYTGNDLPIYLSSLTIVYNVSNNDRSGADTGGGIYIESEFSEKVYFKNSILAENFRLGTIFFVEDNCDGVIESQDYNLIKTVDNCTTNGQTDHNQIGVSPMLSLLGNNGGPTQTHSPQPGSPVIDNANPAGCKDGSGATLLTDQRGEPRHINASGDTNAICDIGSVEYMPRNYLPIIIR